VKIVELAERMIRLAGLEPQRDIEIVFTGIRPASGLTKFCLQTMSPILKSASPASSRQSPSLPTSTR